MKEIIIVVLGLIIVVGGIYFFNQSEETYTAEEETVETTDEQPMPAEPDGGIGDGAGPVEPVLEDEEEIGQSVTGEAIMAYHFGTGEEKVVLIGGIHGGYSWNTALLGNELVAYFKDNADMIPNNVRLTVIPVVNPDGLAQVTNDLYDFTSDDITASDAERVAARFNTNDVDLNRNFNCEWAETSMWQNREVSGGNEPFSEPESRAVRDYVESQQPTAVIAYYSAAGGVYASNCQGGILPETRTLMNLYAEAADYEANEEFDFYEINGDMVNWLAAIDVPAISVLLTTHEDSELSKNLRGIDAVLNYLSDNE